MAIVKHTRFDWFIITALMVRDSRTKRFTYNDVRLMMGEVMGDVAPVKSTSWRYFMKMLDEGVIEKVGTGPAPIQGDREVDLYRITSKGGKLITEINERFATGARVIQTAIKER